MVLRMEVLWAVVLIICNLVLIVSTIECVITILHVISSLKEASCFTRMCNRSSYNSSCARWKQIIAIHCVRLRHLKKKLRNPENKNFFNSIKHRYRCLSLFCSNNDWIIPKATTPLTTATKKKKIKSIFGLLYHLLLSIAVICGYFFVSRKYSYYLVLCLILFMLIIKYSKYDRCIIKFWI